jgi:hypothetical protein
MLSSRTTLLGRWQNLTGKVDQAWINEVIGITAI